MINYQQYYKKDVTIAVFILTLITLFFYWISHSSVNVTVYVQNAPKAPVVASATSPTPKPHNAPALGFTGCTDDYPCYQSPPCETVTPFDYDIDQIFGTQACNAKRTLSWKDAQGNIYGENPNFITENADSIQHDGSVDRGLMRINSATFYDYMKRMPTLLHNNGIYKWSDMLEVVKNIRMAQIVYLYQGWCAWYASPNDLCSANYSDIKTE
jgi:hypothetical protein